MESRDVEAKAVEASIFVVAEAGSGKRVSLPFQHSHQTLKTYMWCIFCKIYGKKLLFDKPAFCIETFLKVCGSLSGQALYPCHFKNEPCSLPAHFLCKSV